MFVNKYQISQWWNEGIKDWKWINTVTVTNQADIQPNGVIIAPGSCYKLGRLFITIMTPEMTMKTEKEEWDVKERERERERGWEREWDRRWLQCFAKAFFFFNLQLPEALQLCMHSG